MPMNDKGLFVISMIAIPEPMGTLFFSLTFITLFCTKFWDFDWWETHFYLQRILVATNLFGRGMDIERVNIVFNYDMPEDTDTYLHRVARAGRFGTKGLAITFVSDEQDAKILNEVQDRFEVDITELPEEIDLSSYIEGR